MRYHRIFAEGRHEEGRRLGEGDAKAFKDFILQTDAETAAEGEIIASVG